MVKVQRPKNYDDMIHKSKIHSTFLFALISRSCIFLFCHENIMGSPLVVLAIPRKFKFKIQSPGFSSGATQEIINYKNKAKGNAMGRHWEINA